jgi:hypothetical protein
MLPVTCTALTAINTQFWMNINHDGMKTNSHYSEKK